MTQPEKPETDVDKTAKLSSSVDVEDTASANGSRDDDLELSTPAPPWQRFKQDTAKVNAEQATVEQVTPPAPAEQPTQGVGESTVHLDHPVVTGTAAPRLLGDQPPTAAYRPPHMEEQQPDRTSVRLGPGPATGPLRTVGTVPPSALRRPGRGPRRASLQIKRFDPWSVLKLSLVLGVALFFVWLVAVGVLYAVLDGMGVWDKVNSTTSELLQTEGASGEKLITPGRVFGVAAIIGAVNIVLFSALSTVAAFVYNVSADLAGGLEVTLAERE